MKTIFGNLVIFHRFRARHWVVVSRLIDRDYACFFGMNSFWISSAVVALMYTVPTLERLVSSIKRTGIAQPSLIRNFINVS
jgi:hypothetical protein